VSATHALRRQTTTSQSTAHLQLLAAPTTDSVAQTGSFRGHTRRLRTAPVAMVQRIAAAAGAAARTAVVVVVAAAAAAAAVAGVVVVEVVVAAVEVLVAVSVLALVG
jgi:hypothetical protein